MYVLSLVQLRTFRRIIASLSLGFNILVHVFLVLCDSVS
jgi:hypothetical protein